MNALHVLPGCHTLTSFQQAKETDASSVVEVAASIGIGRSAAQQHHDKHDVSLWCSLMATLSALLVSLSPFTVVCPLVPPLSLQVLVDLRQTLIKVYAPLGNDFIFSNTGSVLLTMSQVRNHTHYNDDGESLRSHVLLLRVKSSPLSLRFILLFPSA
jgi:hypothetical protein